LDDDPVTADPQPPTDARSAEGSVPAAVEISDGAARRRLGAEIWVVLGLSLAASAVYAVINLIGKLTAGPPLSAQRATVNQSVSPRPYLDLSYQLAGIVVTLVPVVLVLWLLSAPAGDVVRSGVRRLGLDGTRPGGDLWHGVLLAAVIGLPGLGFYLVGRELGITVTVVASALNEHWWTVPVLILQAVKNALLEEVIVVGYLLTRLRQLSWPTWAAFAASALLRGSYHLYQGFGPFLGNAVMGLVFAVYFRRYRRTMPLVIAHTLLDVVAFVGYQLFASASGLG
jgi:membrane protease YdiL (CAAX protease family)